MAVSPAQCAAAGMNDGMQQGIPQHVSWWFPQCAARAGSEQGWYCMCAFEGDSCRTKTSDWVAVVTEFIHQTASNGKVAYRHASSSPWYGNAIGPSATLLWP